MTKPKETWEERFEAKFKHSQFVNYPEIKLFITQEIEKYRNWMREFAVEMGILGVNLPQELGDVKGVVEAIRERVDSEEYVQARIRLHELQVSDTAIIKSKTREKGGIK